MKPLSIAPPASAAEIRSVGKDAGVAFPKQLREVLTRCSAAVQFGWNIPMHHAPMEMSRFPRNSGMRDDIWNLPYIRQHTISVFHRRKEYLAQEDISEAFNSPKMWENQFPFAHLYNGDFLTIDVSNPDGPQPVRYFSHELEGLHGKALAPDFFSFVTVLSQLGWAGRVQDDWFGFLAPEDGDKNYLSTEVEGSRNWLAWLARDPNARDPDEPPQSIVAESPAEKALLTAAEANSAAGVIAALDAGARPDVIRDEDWVFANQDQDARYATAVTHAARNSNIPLLEVLIKRGANLNTRRLALGEAAAEGSLETIRWLIAHGARVNGWKDQLKWWPLHFLTLWPLREDHLAVLEALLKAGADPDVPVRGSITMLMQAEPEVARLLLAHGADVHRRNWIGETALHVTGSAAMVRLLAAYGADVNALSTPKHKSGETAKTPLQAQLTREPRTTDEFKQLPQTRREIVRALIELGADPKLRDGRGFNTLSYCGTVEDFETMRALGLDPFERMSNGGTLLHELARRSLRVLSDYGDLFRYLLKLGLNINAVDDDGWTALHFIAQAEYTKAEDITEMLAAGADKSIRDKKGLRAFDYAPRSHTDVRKLLE
jgi:ankyrin repeat protein